MELSSDAIWQRYLLRISDMNGTGLLKQRRPLTRSLLRSVARSGLGRPLDMACVSNRRAVLGALLAGGLDAIYTLLRGGDIELIVSAMVSVSVFLAWAIAREIDPDRPATATMAMVIAAPLVVVGDPVPGIAAVALLVARVMSGTVGRDLTRVDLVVLTGAGIYSGARIESWPFVVLIALALMVDSSPGRGPAMVFTIIGASSVALIVDVGPNAVLGFEIGIQCVAVGLAGWVAHQTRTAYSTTDHDNSPISESRVNMARTSLVVGVLAAIVLSGGALEAIAPAVAAIFAVALVQLATTISDARNHKVAA